MRCKVMAMLVLAVTAVASKAATLDRLAIGCRKATDMDDVLVAFGKNNGPELLNALVRAKDCKWLEAGTSYSFTPATPNDVARQVKTADGGTYWVLKQFVAAGADASISRPTVDDATFLALATMKAIFSFASANCGGKPSPMAVKAMDLATESNPAKMQFALGQLGPSIEQQAKKRGVQAQCKSVVDAYGPRGDVHAGSWLPAGR